MPLQIIAFPSELGWIALASRGTCVTRVTFGHANPQEAVKRIGESNGCVRSTADGELGRLVKRLQEFVSGQRGDDFLDVHLATEQLTQFQRHVIDHCRRIPPGRTLSYGELARRAGHPGAARAVGSVMAHNRWPLIVPCHRVVAANGIGGFSAPRGVALKRQLLANEQPDLVKSGSP